MCWTQALTGTIMSTGPRVLKEIDFLSEICPSLPPAKKEASVKSPAAAKVVPQPPKRTKLTGDEPGVAAREENEAALVAQLFGDDDSDWEDLDGMFEIIMLMLPSQYSHEI